VACDDYRTISWSSAAPATSFATGNVVLGARADVRPANSIEPVGSTSTVPTVAGENHPAIDTGHASPWAMVLAVMAGGWDELADALNPSHGVVIVSVFVLRTR
jgi:hypothetical protein